MSFVRLSSALTIAILVVNCLPWAHFLFDPAPAFEYTGIWIIALVTGALLVCLAHRTVILRSNRILRLSYMAAGAATAYAFIHIQSVLIRTRDVWPDDPAGVILLLMSTAGSIATTALSISAVCAAIEIHSSSELKRVSGEWAFWSRTVAFVWALSVFLCAFMPVYFCWVVYVPLALFALFVHRRIYMELREMRFSVMEATAGKIA